MRSTNKLHWVILSFTILLLGTGALADDTDDYVPEVTDRVARISFVTGDVQIRRADSQDWEVAVLNLPIVEGDEIATDANGRFEIQFNTYTHLRVAENSHIKFIRLQDEGIAVSVPMGTVVLRAAEFDGGRSYFEIDAPKTTIAIQRAGMYRIEAGVQDSLEVFVEATEGGEARIYSADAGFTLRNERRATVFIAGNRSGEWELAEAYTDEFDKWSIYRDGVIAQRVRDAHYDRYYDRDIYGAEDLNDHGEWVYTRSYGYVWRPYRASIASYSNWSPYRYGHWRWIPPYGWTWINDEPWGWATYHHGRWVWYNGGWYWTPYGYYRHRRSWWRPALVVVSVFGGNVCWYPLPYHYRYYNYNSYYYSNYPWRRRHRDRNDHGGGGGPVGGNPNPSPTPVGGPVNTPIRGGRDKINAPPFEHLPPGGVVTAPVSEFGRGKGRFSTPPLSVAQSVLSKVPDATQPGPVLPTYGDLDGKISREIRVTRPPLVNSQTEIRTGAAVRKSEAPLDNELQKSRILGNRPPLQINTNQGEIKTGGTIDSGSTRKTGAVGRPVIIRGDETPSETPIRQAPPSKQDSPVYTPPVKQAPSEPIRPPVKRDEPQNEPVRVPRYEPPTKRNDPPRNDPPTRSEPPPRSSPPKYDPPPRNDPPPKSDPPPRKSEPSKPTLGPVDRKKDG